MNIAFVSASVVPSRYANSVHVMKLCAAFAELGHVVRLYAVQGEPHTDPYNQYDVPRSFSISFVEKPSTPVLRAIVHSSALRYALRHSDPAPDEIHGRIPLGVAAVADLGIPIVYHSHGIPSRQIQRLAEKYVFSRRTFKRLVCISHALREDYLRLYPRLAPESVIVAPNGADVSVVAVKALEEWPGRDGCLQVGYVGHLYPGRGVDVVVEAAVRTPEIDYHLVGGTEEDLIHWRSQSLPKNIYLHGFRPQAALRSIYKRLDVVLAPYQERVLSAQGAGDSSRWMSPMKIFEYMAAQVPIIASDLPAIREVLQNDVTALLVPPADVTAWIAAIRVLRDDATMRLRLADSAFQVVSTQFTWKARALRCLGMLPHAACDKSGMAVGDLPRLASE